MLEMLVEADELGRPISVTWSVSCGKLERRRRKVAGCKNRPLWKICSYKQAGISYIGCSPGKGGS